jgi:hypothetical protein
VVLLLVAAVAVAAVGPHLLPVVPGQRLAPGKQKKLAFRPVNKKF